MKISREFTYEGEAWLRLTVRESEGRSAFVLEVRPDASKGIARWGRVKSRDRPRKRQKR